MQNLLRVNALKDQAGGFLAVGVGSFDDSIRDLNLLLGRFSRTSPTLRIYSVPNNDKKENSVLVFNNGKSIGSLKVIKSRTKEKSRSRRRSLAEDYAVGRSTWKEFLLIGYFNIVASESRTAERNSNAMRDAFVEYFRRQR